MAIQSVDLTKTVITDFPTTIDVQKAPVYNDKPAALAIALGITVNSVTNICPCDGAEVIDDKSVDIDRFRGFTVHEMIGICLLQGFKVTEIDLALGDDAPKDYLREASAGHYRKIVPFEDFEKALLTGRGFATYYFLDQHPVIERTLAYLGQGTTAVLVDPVAELKLVYPHELVSKTIQLVSLIQIEQG